MRVSVRVARQVPAYVSILVCIRAYGACINPLVAKAIVVAAAARVKVTGVSLGVHADTW